MDERWPLSLPGVEPVRSLGSGGFGRVWLARQTDLDRLVAVKIGHRPLDTADDRRRFERECRALGRLGGHPNIVEVHTSGFDEGLPYLVLAYIGGGTLADHGSTLGEPMLRGVTVQLCKAVGAAHAEQVLHRDLKPENVFLEPGGRVVLGDFGIARLGDGNVTEAVGLSASMAFVAPELLAGATPSPAIDIYGVGITIMAAILGRSPFVSGQESTIEAVLANVSNGPLPDLSPHGITPAFEQILRWAMNRDPSARPSSVMELERAVAGLPPINAETVTTAGAAPTPPVAAVSSPPSPPAESNPVSVSSPSQQFASSHPSHPVPPTPPGAAVPVATTTPPPSLTVSDRAPGRSWGLVGAGVAAVAAVLALVAGIVLLGGAGGDETASAGGETVETGAGNPDAEIPDVEVPEVSVPVVETSTSAPTSTSSSTVPPTPLVLPLTGPEISNLTDIPFEQGGVDPSLGPADSRQFCDERPDITGLTETLAGIYPIEPTTDASLRQLAQRMHRFSTEEQAIAFLDSYTGFSCETWEDATLFEEGVTVLSAELVSPTVVLGDEIREVDQRAETPFGVDIVSRTTLIRRGSDVLKLYYSTLRPGELGPVTDRLAAAAADNLGY